MLCFWLSAVWWGENGFSGLYSILIGRKAREEDSKILVFCSMKRRGNQWRISAVFFGCGPSDRQSVSNFLNVFFFFFAVSYSTENRARDISFGFLFFRLCFGRVREQGNISMFSAPNRKGRWVAESFCDKESFNSALCTEEWSQPLNL
jgi:hypothetical protein